LAPRSLPTSPDFERYETEHRAGSETRPTKAGFWVLGFDSLAPVLAKEHVGRESTLRGLGILLGFTRRLFYFFGGFALENGSSDELDTSIRARRVIRL
jgi:hypothetical protein